MGASAGGIRAGQAYVELLADDRPLQAGLAAAQRHLDAWGKQIRTLGLTVFAAGAGMLTPLVAAAQQFASSGDALDKLATRTGMSVELLSELSYAARASGTSLEDLERASRTLSVTIIEAMKGSQSAIDTLGGADLAKRLNALTQDQRFLAVAHAVALIHEPARRAAAALAVFGRSGTQLLPLVTEMEHLRGEARKLGATMSTEQAHKAAALQDAWERVTGAIARVSKAIGAALAPALTHVANEVLPLLVVLQQWIAHNQALVVHIAKVAAVVAAVGGALVGVATVITALAWAFQSLGTVIGIVIGTWSVLRATVSGLSAVWGMLNTDLLTTAPALRAIAVASALGSTALAGARTGVLLLAAAISRVRLASLAAFSGMPGLLARVTAGAIATARSLRQALGVSSRLPRASNASRGHEVVRAGFQAAGVVRGGMVRGSAAALGTAGTALAGLPSRIGGAFTTLGRNAVAALASIRRAITGVVTSMAGLGSVVMNGVARGFAAIPALAGRGLRAVSALPGLLTTAWGALAGVVASGTSLVGRALMTLPGMAVTAGSALVAGMGRAVAAIPGLFFAVVGVVATAVQALPGLVVSGFAVLRSALVAVPGLFAAAFAALPALIGLALSPVALLGAAIVGLGVYLYHTTNGGQIALGQLGQAFAAVADDAVTAFSAISEALAAGDLTGAVRILWAAIQLEWTRGVAWVENLMAAFAGGIEKLFLHVGFGINVTFWTAVNGIQAAIDWVISGIVKAFTTVIGTIAARIAKLLELVGALDADASQKLTGLASTITTQIDQGRAGRTGERDQRLTDLNNLWNEQIADVNTGMADGMSGRDAEIAAKRAALDAAIADVRRARTSGPSARGPGDAGGGEPPALPDLDTAALSAELAQRMNTVQLNVDTVGAFNTAAIGEMGIGGTAAERGVQAQEKTARNTERIMNAVETNDLSFG